MMAVLVNRERQQMRETKMTHYLAHVTMNSSNKNIYYIYSKEAKGKKVIF